MHLQRHSAASLAALAIGLLSCQFAEHREALPAVSAAPPPLVAPAPLLAPPAPAPAREAAPVALALDVIEARLLARARSLSPEEIGRVAAEIRAAAEDFELAPGLVLAVIEVESQFDAFAVSPVGAMGLMQLLPSTGEALARRYGLAWDGPRTLFDPVSNVRLGVAYLAEMQDLFDHWPTALAAYNWGPGAIGRRLDDGEPVPAGYAKRVLSTQARRAKAQARAS